MTNKPIKSMDLWPGDNFIDYCLGGYRSYRKWRGGYWWRSSLTDCWWRHKAKSEELTEDYR